MRTGAIDCGTNSIRLLIADVPEERGPGEPALSDVVRLMRVVRLGQGVDATGRLADEALERTFSAAEEYGALLREHGAQKLRFVATSATRDAENRQVFTDGIRERLGVEPEIITGLEEASLSFTGAASVLDSGRKLRTMVVDLGGGSTEFVVGTTYDGDSASRSDATSAAPTIESAISTDMGCVRFTERHLHTDPPTPEEISRATADVRSQLERAAADVSFANVDALVGVAGTITTVTAHALKLTSYQPGRIHGAELEAAIIEAASDELTAMTRADRAALPYMHPGRVDVIGAGALIWRTIVAHVQEATGGRVHSAIASEHDILDGIALSAARTP